jgi:hypothetical protein
MLTNTFFTISRSTDKEITVFGEIIFTGNFWAEGFAT